MNNIYIRIRAIIFLVLIVTSTSNVFGQSPININMMSQSGGTTNMECDALYTLNFTDVVTNGSSKTYTFTNENRGIRVAPFFYDATRRMKIEDSKYQYESLTITTSGADGTRTYKYGHNASYNWVTSTTMSQNYIYYIAKNIPVPEIIVMPDNDGIASVTFQFTHTYKGEGISLNDFAHFEATINHINTNCNNSISPIDGMLFYDDNNVEFEWESACPIGDDYDYKLVLKHAGETTNYTPIDNTTYTVNGLSNGSYTWTVMLDGTTEVCWYSTFSVCNGDFSLSPVDHTSLSPSYNSVETLERRLLSWDPVLCANGYKVYVAPTNSVEEEDLLTSQNTLLIETDEPECRLPILPEGEYYWTVVAMNSDKDLVSDHCGIYRFRIKYKTASEHVVTPSTQGKEFFFSLMRNIYDVNGTIKYTAIIAPKEKAVVTFYYYANGTSETYTVQAGQTKTIEMSQDLVYHSTPGEDLNRTVRVTSTADISLYIANEAKNSFDASIVLPTHALGNDYMVQTPYNAISTEGYKGTPCFLIIATKDDTPITISGDYSNRITPEATSIKLNSGDSYFVTSSDYSNDRDLSGIKIAVTPRADHPEDSCKAIAVFNGSTLSGIPHTRGNQFDHLVEQAYPISNWGTKFAITSTTGFKPTNTNPTGYPADLEYIRVTAAENGTVVTKKETAANGTVTTTTLDTLATGATHEFTLHRSKGSCYVETSKPAACYLYQRSSKQVVIGTATTGDNMGDPSMVWISPIERGVEEVTFSTFAATGIDNANHFVNIVIPTEAWSSTDPSKSVTLNGQNISALFSPLSGNPNYMYARKNISHGTYTLTSEGKGKMGVHIYGLGNVRGYAYTAGSAAVPFRSTFAVAAGNGVALDVETLPSDYHFCGNTTYHFSVNSNASGVDSIIFDYGDGTRDTLRITESVRSVEKEFAPGDYNIRALVYSTVYDLEHCQSSVVVDTVREKAFVFANDREVITEYVCKGKPYTFKRYYWRVDDETGELVMDSLIVDYDNVTEPKTVEIDTGRTEYGCELKIILNLNLYQDMYAGSFKKEELECDGGVLTVTQLLSNVSAYGGDPSAHYQWQRSETGAADTWEDIPGQINESYNVTEPGYYRRAYSSICGTVYTSSIQIQAAGSFNPGTHIDSTANICHGTSYTKELGGSINNSSILYNTTGGYYYTVIGGNEIRVDMQWQDSVSSRTTWENISGATDFNYTVNNTFTENTYYRRILTNVSDCGVKLNTGVFEVKIKPKFEFEYTRSAGCFGDNNASVNFTVSGGSGNFTITYFDGSSDGTAVLENGVYKCDGLEQGTEYAFTIHDNVYDCEIETFITTLTTTAVNISQANIVKGCQGSRIDIPIPVVSGGVPNYRMDISSTGLGVPATTVYLDADGSASTYSYNIPSDKRGTYSIVYKAYDANNCPHEVVQDVVIVDTIPVFTLSTTNLTSCASPDGSIGVEFANNIGLSTYKYYINGTLAADNQTNEYVFTGLAQGTYTIKVENGQGCISEKTASISDNSQFEITALVNGTQPPQSGYQICPKTGVTVSVGTIDGEAVVGIASGYKYSFGNDVSYQDNYSTVITSPQTCGLLEVPIYVRNIITSCVSNTTVRISATDNTPPAVLDGCPSGDDIPTYFCESFIIPDYTAIVRQYAYDNCIDEVNNPQDFRIEQSPVAGTSYSVSNGARVVVVTVTDLCGNTTTKNITVTPKPWPKFEIVGNTSYCHRDKVTLTPRLVGGGNIGNSYPSATYQWYKVDNNGSTTPINNGGRYVIGDAYELTIISALPSDYGRYRLSITYGGCTSNAEFHLNIHNPIEFSLE